MPDIKWSVEQAEDVRQVLFDRIEWLAKTHARSAARKDTADAAYLLRSLDHMRDIVRLMEDAYRPDTTNEKGTNV